ncbi:hypothetical protein WDU94_008689 [Cyamophila willieti]
MSHIGDSGKNANMTMAKRGTTELMRVVVLQSTRALMKNMTSIPRLPEAPVSADDCSNWVEQEKNTSHPRGLIIIQNQVRSLKLG